MYVVEFTSGGSVGRIRTSRLYMAEHYATDLAKRWSNVTIWEDWGNSYVLARRVAA